MTAPAKAAPMRSDADLLRLIAQDHNRLAPNAYHSAATLLQIAERIEAKAAPMREDVTQDDEQAARDAIDYLCAMDVCAAGSATLFSGYDMAPFVAIMSRHRLAHTARPDAGAICSRCLGEYILEHDDGPCRNCGGTARPDAGDEDVERLRAALEWYARNVSDCRKVHSEGEVARNALDQDGGLRARAALAAMREGVDRGMVDVPRVLPVAVCDKMTEVKIADGRGGFTALNWEEAEQVWEVALASLATLMSKGQPR